MLNGLRSQNLEVNVKYKAMIKQKMEELEQEWEIIRDPVAAIKESEVRILSVVPLVVIQKHKLMQKLHKRGVYKHLESFSVTTETADWHDPKRSHDARA
ncbi:hypothetical protein MHYP_G00005070 [Metynnis hypsauchen]